MGFWRLIRQRQDLRRDENNPSERDPAHCRRDFDGGRSADVPTAPRTSQELAADPGRRRESGGTGKKHCGDVANNLGREIIAQTVIKTVQKQKALLKFRLG